ncbi:MAG: DUF2694 family protein [Mycobacterium sp.]|nr:DUF2694 family protein [Mycobacterium sp.]
MNPDPLFDAVHPSGQLVFRSCRGGYLHSVVIGESAMDVDTGILARAILLAADVSHLKATMRVRAQIVDAGDSPSGEMPQPGDLEAAELALQCHRLRT